MALASRWLRRPAILHLLWVLVLLRLMVPPIVELAGSIEAVTAEHVFAAARQGDPLALRLVDETTSARDGQFALRSERGGLKAEKLRVVEQFLVAAV